MVEQTPIVGGVASARGCSRVGSPAGREVRSQSADVSRSLRRPSLLRMRGSHLLRTYNVHRPLGRMKRASRASGPKEREVVFWDTSPSTNPCLRLQWAANRDVPLNTLSEQRWN
jgi:hypothetical protein